MGSRKKKRVKKRTKKTMKNKSVPRDIPRYTKQEISEASKMLLQERSAEMEIDWDTVTEYFNTTIGGLKAFQKTLLDTTIAYESEIDSNREKYSLLLGISGGLKELFSECNELVKEHSSVDDEGIRKVFAGKIDGEDCDLLGIGLVSRYGSINEKLGQLMSIGYVELLASLTTSTEELALLDNTVCEYKEDMKEASNAGQQHH